MPIHMTQRGVHVTIDPTTQEANVLAMYGDVLGKVHRDSPGASVFHVTLPGGQKLATVNDWTLAPQIIEDHWGPDEVCKQK